MKCIAGCKVFTGGEIKHHKDCPFYPESLTKMYDDLEKKYVRANEYVAGCIVYMKESSGCPGYGNPQCIRSVCEPLDEISLYGHNKNYRTWDIRKVEEYPIIEVKEQQ